MDDAVIAGLRSLGMSMYEARVYVALLRHGPQNGNEVSRSAGLPSSKIYATLEKLARDGLVHRVQQDGKTEYVSIPANELLRRLRQEYEEPLAYLEKTLPTLAAFEPAAQVLTVSGLAAIRESIRSLVEDAGDEIYISIWADDFADLGAALTIAHHRGVRIFGMLYGDSAPPEIGSWLTHGYLQIVSDRIAGRMLTLVVDGVEAVIAHIPHGGDATAVRTRNPVICLVTREYLHHDMVLQRAQLAIGFDEWDRWWQADPDLRTIILSGTSIGRSPQTTRVKKEAK
jgi:HTH-type transcriptional regulator, sugar sensing transcriptional regulator